MPARRLKSERFILLAVAICLAAMASYNDPAATQKYVVLEHVGASSDKPIWPIILSNQRLDRKFASTLVQDYFDGLSDEVVLPDLTMTEIIQRLRGAAWQAGSDIGQAALYADDTFRLVTMIHGAQQEVLLSHKESIEALRLLLEWELPDAAAEKITTTLRRLGVSDSDHKAALKEFGRAAHPTW